MNRRCIDFQMPLILYKRSIRNTRKDQEKHDRHNEDPSDAMAVAVCNPQALADAELCQLVHDRRMRSTQSFDQSTHDACVRCNAHLLFSFRPRAPHIANAACAIFSAPSLSCCLQTSLSVKGVSVETRPRTADEPRGVDEYPTPRCPTPWRAPRRAGRATPPEAPCGSRSSLVRAAPPGRASCHPSRRGYTTYTAWFGATAGTASSASSSNRWPCRSISGSASTATRGSTHLPREELLEEDDLAAGVDACLARFDGRDEQVSRGEPRLRVVVELAEELSARQRRRLLELCLWAG